MADKVDENPYICRLREKKCYVKLLFEILMLTHTIHVTLACGVFSGLLIVHVCMDHVVYLVDY